MKNTKLVVPVLLLLAVTLSCKMLDGLRGSKDEAGEFSKIAGQVSSYDPNAPPPSSGAAALRRLAELDPNVKRLEGDIEAAERAALKTALAGMQPQPKPGSGTEKLSSPKPPLRLGSALPVVAQSPVVVAVALPVLLVLQGQGGPPAPTASDSMIITAVVSGWSDQFTPNVEAGTGMSGEATETEGGATSTYNMDLGKRADGSTNIGIGIKSEATKNGVSAKTEVTASLDGQRCPNAEGQVSFTMKMRLGAESGGAGYSQELTAFVRAVVNDDAGIDSSTMDLTQGTRQMKDGTQVYVETGVTIKDQGNSRTESNFRVIRHSQQATAGNAEPLSRAGLEAAYGSGATALKMAEQTWLKGGCTKIEAPAPGSVAPSSTTQIPVTVRHRFDGSEVPSKLDAALSGGKSVDPTSLPKTRGTLSYVAPDETGKSATISLTATSRRGRATLDLTASTGGAAYRIVGGLDDWKTNTVVCDIMKPFTLTGGGITLKASGGLSGTYNYTGPFNSHGTGTYTISLPNGLGKPGTMTGGGEGYAAGHKGSGTENYTLTPVEPCN